MTVYSQNIVNLLLRTAFTRILEHSENIPLLVKIDYKTNRLKTKWFKSYDIKIKLRALETFLNLKLFKMLREKVI